MSKNNHRYHANEIVVNTVDETPHAEPIMCVITNCLKLNIRKNPKIGSKIVCVVDALDELMIDMDHSTDEWYHVYTRTGLEGYCMKKYTTLKQ